MSAIQLTWHGHSCFSLEADGFRLVLDPYEDGAVPGCGPLRLSAHQVLCSHEHHDHNARSCVQLLPARPCPFAVRRAKVWHDGAQGARRGENIIHVMEYGGLRVAHLGDLGHILSGEQVQAVGPVDGILIPVGGYYTIDAAQAHQVAEQLKPRWVVPMHYRRGGLGFDVLAPLEDFLALQKDVREADGDSLTLTPDTPAGTVVLQYRG